MDTRTADATTLLTADDLFELPDDGLRHELIEGELRTMPPTGGEHGVVTSRLNRRVGDCVERENLGVVCGAETGFRLHDDPDTVRAPDLAFVSHGRIPPAGLPRGFWSGAPDLAAEVISPNDTYAEVDVKVADWLAAGTRLVWVLNPRRRTVAVHRPDGKIQSLSPGDELDGGEVLPGFSCPVADLFL